MTAIPKDCTGWNFKSQLEYEFTPGLVLEQHCFSSETPDSDIFPDGMVGVTFIDCNLDNCYVPPGNTVVRGSTRRFQVQNDLRDWIIDNESIPVELTDVDYWRRDGYSVDPTDIPEHKVLHVAEMRLDVISGAKTLADIVGPGEAARLHALRDGFIPKVED